MGLVFKDKEGIVDVASIEQRFVSGGAVLQPHLFMMAEKNVG